MEVPEVRGKCHICKETKWVTYCNVCEHFFCEECRGAWFSRTWEFLKERFGGKKPGCCGPM